MAFGCENEDVSGNVSTALSQPIHHSHITIHYSPNTPKNAEPLPDMQA